MGVRLLLLCDQGRQSRESVHSVPVQRLQHQLQKHRPGLHVWPGRLTGTGNCVCKAGPWGTGCENDCLGGLSNICYGHVSCDNSFSGGGDNTCQANYFGVDGLRECARSRQGVCSGNG